MAFEASFSYVQYGTSTLVLTDESTGTDLTITERRIYLYLYDESTIGSDGEVIAPGTDTPYIVWPIADTTITLTNVLTRDWAVNMVVIWVVPVPDPDNTYEYEILTEFDAYTMVFLGQLETEQYARYPYIINDSGFNVQTARLFSAVQQARNAITTLQNIFLSQGALDSAYYMMQNTQFFF